MNKVIRKIKKSFINEDIRNIMNGKKTTLLLIIITIIGMIIGTLLINFISLYTIKRIDILFLSDFDNRISENNINIFVSSFSTVFLFWISFLSVSLSFLGPVLVLFLLFFRSAGLGLTAGYLYLIYGFKGVAFYILVLLPGMFISSIGFVLIAEKSIKFSIKVAKKFLPNPDTDRIWENMILYLKECGYILIILMISSLIDVCFMNIFSHIFNF